MAMPDHNQLSDPELIALARKGDDAAREALFARNHKIVIAWIRRNCSGLVRNHDSASDLAQSALGLALRDFDRFEDRGTASFRNWLITYANSRLIDRHRFWEAECRNPNREVGRSSQVEQKMASPSEIAMRHEQITVFSTALEQLRGADQDVIRMAKIEGLSHAEIALRLQKSETASRSLLKRALSRLAAKMTRPSNP